MAESTGGFTTLDGRSVLVTPGGEEVGSTTPRVFERGTRQRATSDSPRRSQPRQSQEPMIEELQTPAPIQDLTPSPQPQPFFSRISPQINEFSNINRGSLDRPNNRLSETQEEEAAFRQRIRRQQTRQREFERGFGRVNELSAAIVASGRRNPRGRGLIGEETNREVLNVVLGTIPGVGGAVVSSAEKGQLAIQGLSSRDPEIRSATRRELGRAAQDPEFTGALNPTTPRGRANIIVGASAVVVAGGVSRAARNRPTPQGRGTRVADVQEISLTDPVRITQEGGQVNTFNSAVGRGEVFRRQPGAVGRVQDRVPALRTERQPFRFSSEGEQLVLLTETEVIRGVPTTSQRGVFQTRSQLITGEETVNVFSGGEFRNVATPQRSFTEFRGVSASREFEFRSAGVSASEVIGETPQGRTIRTRTGQVSRSQDVEVLGRSEGINLQPNIQPEFQSGEVSFSRGSSPGQFNIQDIFSQNIEAIAPRVVPEAPNLGPGARNVRPGPFTPKNQESALDLISDGNFDIINQDLQSFNTPVQETRFINPIVSQGRLQLTGVNIAQQFSQQDRIEQQTFIDTPPQDQLSQQQLQNINIVPPFNPLNPLGLPGFALPPFLPPIPAGGSRLPNFDSGIRSTQPKKRTPSAFAFALNIESSERDLFGEFTGLGVRPVIRNKSKRRKK